MTASLIKAAAEIREERWCASSGSLPCRRKTAKGDAQSLYRDSVNI
jgi:hypothetical protein